MSAPATAAVRAVDDVGEGMGTPTASEVFPSVGGLFVVSAATAEEALQEAHGEMVRSISDDLDYWARLSSQVYFESVSPTDIAGVQDEFKQYALEWRRYGRGADVIGDFAAHRKLRQDRFERREAAKRTKEAAAALRASGAHRGSYGGGSGGGSGGRGATDETMYTPVDAAFVDDPEMVLAVLVAIDEQLSKVDGVCESPPQVDDFQRDLLVRGYDHMMASLQDPRFKHRYGYTSADHRAPPLRFGADVPSYFANVKDQSIFRRKVLSIAGLRNLAQWGPIIYKQLKDKKFSGDLSAYGADEGLNLMRRVTGNVVDLDTTVLRCSDRATLNAINMSNKHKGLPQFGSTEEFARSPQAAEIAVNCSLPLFDDFAKMMKLNDEGRSKRRIHASQIQQPIPVAASNTDRGKHPVWHYQNCGVDSFHANVPEMEAVNGALLKAPFHCLQYWLHIHCLFKGDELAGRVDDFFENCISDACFNGKWHAIELFGEKLAHEGTIVDVLQRAQMDNQQIFTCAFFDADDENRSKEVDEMCKLCVGRVGRDKSKKLRPITREDVEAWVADPAVVI